MGLGKTCTSVLWSELTTKRLFYTAPKEVTSNLKEEIVKWTRRPIIDLRNMNKSRRDSTIEIIRDLDTYIVLLNLESWSRDKGLLEGLISLQFQGIVIDEAHHINNTRTSAFKGVRELAFAVNQCPDCGALVVPRYKCSRRGCDSGGVLNRFRHCLFCGHLQALVSVPDCPCGCKLSRRLRGARSVRGVVPMTGTPLLNEPENLWPLAHLVDEAEFPSAKKFRDDYTFAIGNGKSVFKIGAQERLVRKLGRRFIQRSRSDAGIVLPPQTVEILEYDKDLVNYPEQWEAYRNLEDFFAIQLESDVVPVTEVVVQLTRLRQMLTWPRGIEIKDELGEVVGQVSIEKSQKLDIVYEKINEYVACGQRTVAFSHHKAPLRELQRRLGDTAIVYDGDTSQSVREAIRRDFAEAHAYPQWSVLLCNYRSTGESLTLVGATQTVVIDSEFSPGKTKQANRRTDRIGQRQETRVHIPRITKTVDTWLASINAFKERMESEFYELANYQSELLKAIRGEV